MANNTGVYYYNTVLKCVVKQNNKIPNLNKGFQESADNETPSDLGIDRILKERKPLPPHISGYDYNSEPIHSKEGFI